jgi:hypothetical protein
MSGSLGGLLPQFASAVKMRGTTAILRRAAKTGGPNPVPMPPLCENPEVAQLTAAGSGSISISASAANGALVAGDQMTIAGVTYTVQAQALSQPNSAAPGFLSVPVLPLVAADIAAGTPVAFTFSLDQAVYVTVGTYALGLIDGAVIQSADLQFTLANWDLSAGMPIVAPTQTDQIIFNGSQMSIQAITPKIIMGAIVGYSIQARA